MPSRYLFFPSSYLFTSQLFIYIYTSLLADVASSPSATKNYEKKIRALQLLGEYRRLMAAP
jgi:hypothetical protein